MATRPRQDKRLAAMHKATDALNEWEDMRWPNGAPDPDAVANDESKLLLHIARILREGLA